MKDILFRADSSSSIGTGHIMRDLVLASQYKNVNIIFVTQNLDGNINHKIIEAGYEIELIKSNDIQEFIDIVKKYKADLVVIDNYAIDYDYEKILKEKTGVNILAIDDTYEKHYCDILLNHNIYAEEKNYKELVPSHCELRCGVKHTLLRDEFSETYLLRKKKTNQKLKVFMAMGGTDSKHINILILEKIKNLPLEISLVTTQANKNLNELQNYVQDNENIVLHVDSSNIANLIISCDIALVTPSVIINEIIFLKIPFISVMVTKNQHYMDMFLKEKEFPSINITQLDLLPSSIENFFDRKYCEKQISKINMIINMRIDK
jgi:UDP-2,4-diacetamido-2,4,6-trideoxy-beta-L-altropyranose hydrolase